MPLYAFITLIAFSGFVLTQHIYRKKITSEINIDNVQSVKYQYEFEGGQETAIILPLGEFSLILGNGKDEYKNEFSSVVKSFKFFKDVLPLPYIICARATEYSSYLSIRIFREYLIQ